MAGMGPYVESNEPINPMPGIVAGALIGGGMTGMVGAAGVGIRSKKQSSKVKSIEKKIKREKEKHSSLVEGETENKHTRSSKKYDERLEKQNKKLEHHESKRIKGGRKAGIIGGTALVGSIIGGSAGWAGNYYD